MKNEYDSEKGQGCICFSVISEKFFPFQGVSLDYNLLWNLSRAGMLGCWVRFFFFLIAVA